MKIKQTKRFIAVLLSLVMVFTLMPMSSLTATAENIAVKNIDIFDVVGPTAGQLADFTFDYAGDSGYEKCLSGEAYSYWSVTDYKPLTFTDGQSDTVSDGEIKTSAFSFEKYKHYTFVAYIKATDGYEISPSATTATVNGNKANLTQTDDCFVVWYTFKCDGAIYQITINDVVEPVVGNTSNGSFTALNSDLAGYTFETFEPNDSRSSWTELEHYPYDLDFYVDDEYIAYENSTNQLTFKNGKYYTFQLSLSVEEDDDAYFSENLKVVINGKVAKADIYDNYCDIWYSFHLPGATICDAKVTGITEPAIGAAADYSFAVPASANYKAADAFWAVTDEPPTSWSDINAADWYYKDDEYDVLSFEPGKFYTFVAVIKAKEGYELSQNISARLNGKSAEAVYTPYLGTCIYKSFYVRGKALSSVSVKIPTPVVGEKASFKYTIPKGAGYEKSPSYIEEGVYADCYWVYYNEYSMGIHYPHQGSFKFEEGKIYMFVPSLQTVDGAYPTEQTKFTINGKTAESDIDSFEPETGYNYLSMAYPFVPTTKNPNVKLSVSTVTYNGKVRSPYVKVKNLAGKKLTKDEDYILKTPSGRKNPGIYKYTVTLTGMYSGTKNLYFKIKPSKQSISKITTPYAKSARVYWKKDTKVSGYRIYYSTSKSFKSYKKVDVTNPNYYGTTIKNLTPGKTYYFKVRSFKKTSYGTVYSDLSSAKYVKVK